VARGAPASGAMPAMPEMLGNDIWKAEQSPKTLMSWSCRQTTLIALSQEHVKGNGKIEWALVSK